MAAPEIGDVIAYMELGRICVDQWSSDSVLSIANYLERKKITPVILMRAAEVEARVKENMK